MTPSSRPSPELAFLFPRFFSPLRPGWKSARCSTATDLAEQERARAVLQMCGCVLTAFRAPVILIYTYPAPAPCRRDTQGRTPAFARFVLWKNSPYAYHDARRRREVY